jgi:alkylhydroperoxidase family enzyme
MARIALLKTEDMNEQQRAVFDGFKINLTRALLRTTGSAGPYLQLGATFPKSELGARNAEVVITRVAVLSNSQYELAQHHDRALDVGISEKELTAIASGELAQLSANDQTLVRYVDECVRDVRVSDATFKEAASILTETQIADLTLLIGHYMMTARFLETLEVDVDKPADKW